MSKKQETAEQEAAARHFLGDLIYYAMAAAPGPLKASEIAKSVREHLPVSPRLIRESLESDPRFRAVDRRWTATARQELATRPFAGAVTAALESYGKPLTPQAVAAQIAASRRRLPQELYDLTAHVLATVSPHIRLGDEAYGLSSWVIKASAGEDEESVAFYNDLAHDPQVAEGLQAIGRRRVRRDRAIDTAEAILEAVGGPLPSRVLSFLVWRENGLVQAPERLFAAMLADERFHLLSGPRWCSADYHQMLVTTLEQLSAKVDRAAGPAAAAIDLAQVLASEPAGAGGFTISGADLDEAVRAIEEEPGAPLDELVQDVFGLYPGDEDFVAAVHALKKRLDGAERVVVVGVGQYYPASAVPARVERVPQVLVPVYVEKQALDGDPVDALLTDGGLEEDLAERVHDPAFEDVGEEEEAVLDAKAKLPTEIRYAVPYHHVQAGTMKVRQMDRGVISESPARVRAVLRYEQQEYEVWINNEKGLLHGLEGFYGEYVAAPGSVIRIAAGDEPGHYELRYDGETDPDCYIDEGRMRELLELREAAAKTEMPVYDLLRALMPHHEQGTRLETLVAELNVVRRTSKRVVASDLSSYHCFHTRKKRPDLWLYDERAVEQGRKKAKKKFFRRARSQ